MRPWTRATVSWAAVVKIVQVSTASRLLALGESMPMSGRLFVHMQVETTTCYAHLAQDLVYDSAVRVSESIARNILQGYPDG